MTDIKLTPAELAAIANDTDRVTDIWRAMWDEYSKRMLAKIDREIMQAMNPQGPDHPPVDVRFGEGTWWTFKCKACGFENGGFIESERNRRASEEQDKWSPLNRPCVRCESGPVVWHRDELNNERP